MLKRSATLYLVGFLFGFFVSGILLFIYPSFYSMFLDFLRQKAVAQSKVIPNISLMIIVNNLVAAGLAAFGGVGVSKIVNAFDSETAKNKTILYFLPGGILFVNGEVLGLLAVFYREHVSQFLAGIFPHGFFEIPAIILSGAIGLDISEESQRATGYFQENLTLQVRANMAKFSLVVILVIIGGLLEGGAF
jgi:uncharacterized membrane protein SpoIIM required for sporulation